MQKQELMQMLRQAKSEKQLTMKDISKKSAVAIRTVNRIFAGDDVRMSSLQAVLQILDLDLRIHSDSKNSKAIK